MQEFIHIPAYFFNLSRGNAYVYMYIYAFVCQVYQLTVG